jgi:hypothetical protein
VDVVPILPEQMGLDDVLLVPARNESVHKSLPEPLSLVDRAEQFVTTYQDRESNSSTAVDSFVRSLQISREDQMSIENMTKGQFSNQKYRQYRRCMITTMVDHQLPRVDQQQPWVDHQLLPELIMYDDLPLISCIT